MATSAASAAGSVRDRTREFFAIAEEMERGSGPLAVQAPRTVALDRSERRRQRQMFSERARDIAYGIQRTSALLHALTKLAQKRSLHDDPTAQINELTGSVKAQIAQLNHGLEDLQRLHEVERGQTNRFDDAHTQNVIDSLKGNLMGQTEAFKEVLQARTDSLRWQQERKQQFASTSMQRAKEASPSFYKKPSSARAASTEEHDAESGGVAVQAQMTEERLDESRLTAVQQIESTIQELGQIFNQLASMVQRQGELVDRIDTDVENTLGNVESAQSQLLKHLESVTSSRALILKVFFVLLLFLILFIVFI